MTAERHIGDAARAAIDAINAAQRVMDAMSRGHQPTWSEIDHIRRAITAALVRIEQTRANLAVREPA